MATAYFKNLAVHNVRILWGDMLLRCRVKNFGELNGFIKKKSNFSAVRWFYK